MSTVDRTREPDATPGGHRPSVYLAGLDLTGRRVLVAGAGRVATRRIPLLVEAGAELHVVAPEASELVGELAGQGRLRWSPRRVSAADVDGAWYVVAATDEPETNAMLAGAAETRHTFCVRVDDATGGSARTPATGQVGDLTVAVIGDRDPRRSRAARDAALRAVEQLGETAAGPANGLHPDRRA